VSSWPRQPAIYEINTWVWLYGLSQQERRPVTLATVAAREWDAIASYGFDGVWLMGVWERSPAGIAVARQNATLQDEFHRALPDCRDDDIVGSPYCVRQYAVDPHLGGPQGLAEARKQLATRDLRLVLDFVPNHVAPDHPWVSEHPEYFIQGSREDLNRSPVEYREIRGNILALGRDPYFPPWSDVLQLNAFHPGLRRAIITTVRSVAEQCDGLRCDMAMLAMNSIFERTWKDRAGSRPANEYCTELIQTVRKEHPDLLFIAEAYWDLESELQRQGFDYCYDKRLYDCLEHDTAENIRLHLCADLAYQEKLIRFVENHDEPRAASTFSPPKARAAAVIAATLPGASLFHDGQFEGRRVKVPVFLRRRPQEQADPNLQTFYRRLLRALKTGLKDGTWQLCERTGWPDNDRYLNLVAWCWAKGKDHCLIVVNLSDIKSQGRIRVPLDDLPGRMWQMADAFASPVFERDGNELRDPGLYVELDPWQFHVLRF
jgi:glycosidase